MILNIQGCVFNIYFHVIANERYDSRLTTEYIYITTCGTAWPYAPCCKGCTRMSGLEGSGRWLHTCLSCLPNLVLQPPGGFRHLPRFHSTHMSSLKRRGSTLCLWLGRMNAELELFWCCCCGGWYCCWVGFPSPCWKFLGFVAIFFWLAKSDQVFLKA